MRKIKGFMVDKFINFAEFINKCLEKEIETHSDTKEVIENEKKIRAYKIKNEKYKRRWEWVMGSFSRKLPPRKQDHINIIEVVIIIILMYSFYKLYGSVWDES